MKNKSLIITIAVLAIIVIYGVSVYNGLVNKDETVNSAWSNVETQYQRRSDLIPNLVNTVKGYAKHESQTLEAVISARSKATQVNINAKDLTAENMKTYQEAQNSVSGALGKLIAVAEAYPNLKANEQFLELQAQLEGTENRINESRRIFNKEAKDYNASIRRFPNSIIAGLGGFEKYPYFEAAEGTEKAPSVSFE
ncbi:MAG: LemA family protein [Paludibacteraceae bacterium]